jgi:hypothetical protein
MVWFVFPSVLLSSFWLWMSSIDCYNRVVRNPGTFSLGTESFVLYYVLVIYLLIFYFRILKCVSCVINK